jgi:hypothetical protein
MTRFATLMCLLVAAACGSSEPAPGATTPAAGEAGEGQADHHHELTPELDAFHELLAPLWHADKGEARRSKTCSSMPDFKTKAAAVKGAAAPASVDAAAWTGAGGELEAAVSGLETACAGADLAAFEPAFEAVHTKFHGAMELVAGKHEHGPGKGHEHGEHGKAAAEGDQGGW